MVQGKKVKRLASDQLSQSRVISRSELFNVTVNLVPRVNGLLGQRVVALTRLRNGQREKRKITGFFFNSPSPQRSCPFQSSKRDWAPVNTLFKLRRITK